jgi:UDP-N-acetylglucosamine 4-epimerase
MAALKIDLSPIIRDEPRRWLVTGSAGFIGSHLLETLLRFGQTVVSVDSFITGHRKNLLEVRERVGEEAWKRHRFIEGDITDPSLCRHACATVDVILHQAALGSVPRSIEKPLATHEANVTGFLNILDAARGAGIKRLVYASSSSVYGDDPNLPKTEATTGRPLSPYAASKQANELYAGVFGRCYGLETIGLRYFNVFGPRQDPQGAYAAVIPRWVSELLSGKQCVIHGDGETSRDFCYIQNVVQANLLAAATSNPRALGNVFNVAYGESTTLNKLHGMISEALKAVHPDLQIAPVAHGDFRPGDVRHSLADISKATQLLGYRPSHAIQAGLAEAIDWYVTMPTPAVAG